MKLNDPTIEFNYVDGKLKVPRKYYDDPKIGLDRLVFMPWLNTDAHIIIDRPCYINM